MSLKRLADQNEAEYCRLWNVEEREAIKQRFELLAGELNERTRRLVAAAEALSLGWGGISAVSRATGVSRRAIRQGIKELQEPTGTSAGRIRRNAAAFGVPGLEVVEGAAPAAFEGLAQPDAVFIGGGATIVLDAAVRALRAGGRLVVNAVTAETEALLLQRQATLGLFER